MQETESETAMKVGQRLVETVGFEFGESELGQEWFIRMLPALRRGDLVIIRTKEYGFARGLEIRSQP